MYEMWANWMVKENDGLGYTKAGNRKHPTRTNCVDWAWQAWQDLRPAIITKTAPKVYMTPDPGPPIPGYKGGNFGDEPEENEDELSERDIEENDE